jgi:phage prohead protease, HK97 family
MPVKTDEREYRKFEGMEVRRSEDGAKVVEGYATTFNQPYQLWRDRDITVNEQVDPRAFDETDMSDVIMQYDHKGRVFARISNGTLRLEADDHGLKVVADLGGTEIGRQLFEEINGGYTNKMSFGFTVTGEEKKRTEEDGRVTILRTITKIGKLYDVSAVSLPANDATEISSRMIGDGLISEAEKEIQAEEDRRRRIGEIRNILKGTNQMHDEIMTRLGEIETRTKEIDTELEQEGSDLDALKEEARSLVAERDQLNQQLEELRKQAEEAEEARKAVENGAGKTKENVLEDKTMTLEELRSSKEYVEAYANYLKSCIRGKEDDRECRALLTTNATAATGYVPVPTLVDDIVRHAWENENVLARVKKTGFTGNVKVAFEKTADPAYVHSEGATAHTEEALTLGIVEIKPENIKKWITVSDEMMETTGEGFLTYVYEELAYQVMKKLSYDVVADIKDCVYTSHQATAVGIPTREEEPGHHDHREGRREPERRSSESLHPDEPADQGRVPGSLCRGQLRSRSLPGPAGDSYRRDPCDRHPERKRHLRHRGRPLRGAGQLPRGRRPEADPGSVFPRGA